MVDLEWDDADNEAVNAGNEGAVSEEEEVAEPVGSPQNGEDGGESSSFEEGRSKGRPG